jgi:probable phosphoglycerate mutase
LTSTPASEKTVSIFRHGETDWNKVGRVQGHTDIPLNATGRAQALRLREFFKNNPVEIFLSSDLQRARETAEIASNGQAPVVIDPLMRETNLGQAEGLTRDEIILKFGDDVWENWHATKPERWQARFPGGESKAEHLARLLACLEKFLTSSPYRRVGVASHGGAMRRILHHLRPELDNSMAIGNGVVYELTFRLHDRSWFAHLDPRHV